MPTKTKLKADEIYICWMSFAGNEGLKCAEGARLRGDHELVKRFPDRFVIDGTPDDEINALKAAALSFPEPEPLGRCKVRILAERGQPTGRPQAIVGDREFYGGETPVLEGKQAQHLLDGGVAEIVKVL